MDAKERIKKMRESGVLNAEQARRLQSSIDVDSINPNQTPEHSPFKRAILIGLLTAFAICLISVWIIARNLIAAQENMLAVEAGLQSQYQRRFELIPQLLGSIKGYMTHERETLVEVTEQRNNHWQPLQKSIQLLEQNLDREGHKPELSGNLQHLLAVAEQYPNLKAADQFMTLQAQIEGTENRINIARLKLNEATKRYNKTVRNIPHRWVARWFGFKTLPYLTVENQVRAAPLIEFE